MSNPLFNIRNGLFVIAFLLTVSVQAQQRDRLGELDVVCRNEIVTHTSVAPDGTLWMATECGEIYRADDIHSPWRILKEGSLGGDQGETFENIVAFENIDYGNALYILFDNWQEISQMSRIDILKRHEKDYIRIIHKDGWEKVLKRYIDELKD